MKRNRRLSITLHALAHLAEPARPLRTSEELARCVGTNPVVIRRTLAALRDAGFVRSAAGPGGGWSLARPAEELSLGEVCRALGERLLYAVELAAPSGCAVQASVGGVLDGFLREAEAQLLERLDRMSIAALAARVHGATPDHEVASR